VDTAAVGHAACCIDDAAPLTVLRPGNPAEVGELVRQALAQSQALYPVGGGTLLGVGLPPERPGWAIDTRGLAAVIDYPARDMTITVQAGITVAELQRTLAAENQRLPIDVPKPEQATLGGALAVNVSGPRRYGFGTLRDYLIGITTINDEGQEVKAGGRVVKNVAGYDLCKLHVGALGTLGILTQVTFKLRPLPEAQALVTFGCDTSRLSALLDLVHGSRTRPVCIDLLNSRAAQAITQGEGITLPGAPWVVAVGFEDSSPAVKWQVGQLLMEVAAAGLCGVEARAGGAAEPLWKALVDLTARPVAVLTFKANLLPGAVADFCCAADKLPEGLLLHAHAGSGIVRGHAGSGLTLEGAQAMLKGLTDRAVAAGGNLLLPHCPPPWKRHLPVWGEPRGDLGLMRQVKAHLDPRRLFNPGRFVGGI
jgi:glycolate oxidase FAD binding subunit